MQKLWVQHQTTAKTFGPSKVSIQECSDVYDFLKEIKREFEIPGPSSHLTLYQPGGTVEIDVGDSPANYLNGNTSKNPLVVKTLSFAPKTGLISVESPLVGKVLSVSINQSKLIKKYLTPVGSTSSTPVENSSTPVDISSLGLQLEQLMFCKNTTARPCIVVHVERDYDWTAIEGAPPITIVLITGFDGKPLHEVMAEEEFKRVMPIGFHPSPPGTATPINTTPEWSTHSNRKVPSYILCIPIKVHAQNLHRLEDDSIHLDRHNLQKLQMHILALGGISANADFVDLEEDDSDDDDVEVSCGDVNRIISWDEIAV